jgi:hypothetical protein
MGEASRLLADPDTFATTLHAIAVNAYGFEDLYGSEELEPLDPLELYADLEADFHIELPEENQNKLQAIITLMTTDAFYEDPLAFISIAHAFSDGDLGDLITGAFEPITLPQGMWAVFEADLNRGDNHPGIANSIQQLLVEVATEDPDEMDDAEGPQQVLLSVEELMQESKAQLKQELESLGIQTEFLTKLHAG